MTRLFRSKSCGLAEFNTAPPSPIFIVNEEEETENDDEDEEEEEEESDEDEDEALYNPMTTPFSNKARLFRGNSNNNNIKNNCNNNNNNNSYQFAIVDILVTALRKSIVTCSVERDDVSSSSSSALEISWPTEVRHVSHVTFDRYNGFLGLPTELEPQLPRRVPSASVSVFGVSAQSMQCTYDDRGNSVPTILLMMQKRLYSGGGLQAEGIFRINAENSQEERVRDRLNKGVVPHGIDVHCLAGLIKAWFRELPTGVLDSLRPEQVMHCNTEDDCTKLVKLLPPTEASLLDWAVNLMADVVHNEDYNKMNARNIAMVFAPNMTQMADPLTALIHAVQVMNFLKTLIMKTLRDREESATKPRFLSTFSKPPTKATNPASSGSNADGPIEQNSDAKQPCDRMTIGNKLRTSTFDILEPSIDEALWCSQIKSEEEEEEATRDNSSTRSRLADHFRRTTSDNGCVMRAESPCRGGGYEAGDWLSLRKGVRRLCRHPVFQLNKPAKKTPTLGIVNTNNRERGGEAWA